MEVHQWQGIAMSFNTVEQICLVTVTVQARANLLDVMLASSGSSGASSNSSNSSDSGDEPADYQHLHRLHRFRRQKKGKTAISSPMTELSSPV